MVNLQSSHWDWKNGIEFLVTEINPKYWESMEKINKLKK